MTKRVQLLGLCAMERENLNQPFELERANAKYDCATNGHAMIMLGGATWPSHDKAPADGILKILDETDDYSSKANVEGLLEWSFGSLEICEDGLNATQPGKVGDGYVNRRILYRFLLIGSVYAPSTRHQVAWRGPEDPISVRSEGLEIVVMPFRHTPGEDDKIHKLKDLEVKG